MSDVSDTPPPERARKKAQNTYEVAEARTKLVKQMVEAENAARDAKTIKLRALRLAKEEAERAEALAHPVAPVKAKKRRVIRT